MSDQLGMDDSQKEAFQNRMDWLVFEYVNREGKLSKSDVNNFYGELGNMVQEQLN